MPGYDSTGPLGAGPRTGRGRGRGGSLADGTTGVGGQYAGERVGRFGRRFRGGRGRGFGSGGWGRRWGLGFGMGGRAFDDAARDDVTPGRRQAFLRRRIGELKAELDRMSELLSESSREGTAGQE